MKYRYFTAELEKRCDEIFWHGTITLSTPYNWDTDYSVCWERSWKFIGLTREGLNRRMSRHVDKLKKHSDLELVQMVQWDSGTTEWA